jgi:hypothetical protein
VDPEEVMRNHGVMGPTNGPGVRNVNTEVVDKEKM